MNRTNGEHFVSFLRYKVLEENWDFSVVFSMMGLEYTAEEQKEQKALLLELKPCGAVACAIGHARAAFSLLQGDDYKVDEELRGILDMPEDDFNTIFGYYERYTVEVYDTDNAKRVTKNQVADALERYMDEGAFWL